MWATGWNCLLYTHVETRHVDPIANNDIDKFIRCAIFPEENLCIEDFSGGKELRDASQVCFASQIQAEVLFRVVLASLPGEGQGQVGQLWLCKKNIKPI